MKEMAPPGLDCADPAADAERQSDPITDLDAINCGTCLSDRLRHAVTLRIVRKQVRRRISVGIHGQWHHVRYWFAHWWCMGDGQY